MIVVYSLLVGCDRVWVHEDKDGNLKVKKCKCRHEAIAVMSHLSGLDHKAPEFRKQAAGRLAAIGMGLRK